MAFRSPPEVILRQCIRGTKLLKLKPPIVRVCAARTYKAAVCTKLGQPLEIQEKEFTSSIKDNEALVSIHSHGINFADILMNKGQYQRRLRTPFIPGSEMAGKVVKVGSDVQNVKEGDRVLLMSLDGCGAASEYFVADSQFLYPVPDHLSLDQAAATITSYATALVTLQRKASLKQGETVLVTAGAGATGLALTDVARNLFDCQVISVCGGPEKCAFAKERGATHTIDYTCQNLRQEVKELTNGEGVNVVVDQVGGDGFLDCIKSLAFEGRAMTVGYASGKIPSVPANLLLLKNASLIGSFWGGFASGDPTVLFQSIVDVLKYVSQRKLNPYVGKTFPLEQINEAYQYIMDRKSVGKVVIQLKEE